MSAEFVEYARQLNKPALEALKRYARPEIDAYEAPRRLLIADPHSDDRADQD